MQQTLWKRQVPPSVAPQAGGCAQLVRGQELLSLASKGRPGQDMEVMAECRAVRRAAGVCTRAHVCVCRSACGVRDCGKCGVQGPGGGSAWRAWALGPALLLTGT